MALQTLEDLEALIDSDLAWRRKEMTNLYFAILDTDGSYKGVLCKSGFAILYAHFEGFVKFSCEKYYEYVVVRNLKYGELADSFWALALRKRLIEATKETGTEAVIDCVHFIRNCDQERIRLPKDSVINTKSNLNSSRFSTILGNLNMDTNMYESKYAYIDEILLETRNSIAHGSSRDVKLDDFIEAKNIVTYFIEILAVHIYESASSRQYRSLI